MIIRTDIQMTIMEFYFYLWFFCICLWTIYLLKSNEFTHLSQAFIFVLLTSFVYWKFCSPYFVFDYYLILFCYKTTRTCLHFKKILRGEMEVTYVKVRCIVPHREFAYPRLFPPFFDFSFSPFLHTHNLVISNSLSLPYFIMSLKEETKFWISFCAHQSLSQSIIRTRSIYWVLRV